MILSREACIQRLLSPLRSEFIPKTLLVKGQRVHFWAMCLSMPSKRHVKTMTLAKTALQGFHAATLQT